jgi:DNA polymerase III psi subunit
MRVSKRQKAYLDAMGIGVWSLREQPQAAVDEVGESAFAGVPVDVVADVPADEPVHTPDMSPVEDPAGTPGLKLGPGRGGVLLICAQDGDSASRLANDINRALGKPPVWAWPDTGSGAVKLDAAVQENLFTTVAIFGDELKQRYFEGELPASMHGASLVQLPAMQEISSRAEARRTLWAVLSRAGMLVQYSG